MKLQPPDFSRVSPGIKNESFKIISGEFLPFWTCDRSIYHIVFHLADSVPEHVRRQLLGERDEMITQISEGRLPTVEERLYANFLFSDKVDSYLDAGNGMAFMKDPRIADLVQSALLFGHGKDYELYEFAVMPNHVHLIMGFEKGDAVKRIVTGIKSFTGRGINRLLGRKGDVWAKDAYNRIIRTEDEYRNQRDYVRLNPSRAGLKGWKWVSE